MWLTTVIVMHDSVATSVIEHCRCACCSLHGVKKLSCSRVYTCVKSKMMQSVPYTHYTATELAGAHAGQSSLTQS